MDKWRRDYIAGQTLRFPTQDASHNNDFCLRFGAWRDARIFAFLSIGQRVPLMWFSNRSLSQEDFGSAFFKLEGVRGIKEMDGQASVGAGLIA